MVQRTSAVKVVLGEAQPGMLRLVLEAQGFDVVGHARGDDELRLVLSVVHPTVVVLDAGISAQAALEARSLAVGVPFVVVWPQGVSAVVAEERVEPELALHDLGAAVHRAASRRHLLDLDHDLVRLPDVDPVESGPVAGYAALGPIEPAELIEPAERIEPEPIEPEPVEPAPAPRGRRRARRLLVTTAAWTLSLTALATIGLAVPSAMRVFDEPAREPRHTAGIAEPAPSRQPDHARTRPDRRPEQRAGPVCEAKPAHANAETDGAGDRGRGCGRGRPDEGEQRGNGRGRPDTPGGRGEGNAGHAEKEPNEATEPEQPKDRDEPRGGNGDGGGTGGAATGGHGRGRGGDAGDSGGNGGGGTGTGTGAAA